MIDSSYEVIIIGCGPAGFYGALSCAARGYKTLIIERESPGGTGIRWGSLPVKGGLDLFRGCAGYRSPGELNEAYHTRMKRVSKTEELFLNKLKEAGVTYMKGEPEIISPRMIKVVSEKGGTLSCRYLVIATGTSPSAPSGFNLDGRICISHKELLFRQDLPERLDILGGNVEGIELAFLYSALGVPVRVTEMEDEILPGNDPDLIAPLKAKLESMGVEFRLGFKAESPDAIAPDLSEDKPLLITGFREPNMPKGIEHIEPKLFKGFIKTEDTLETSVSGVFAIGDVNGLHGMAHVAINQGVHLGKGFTGDKVVGDYSILPRSIFTIPEITGAGLQESNLENPEEYHVVKIPLSNTWRGFIREESGFFKVIFKKSGELAGIWGTGRDLSEIISPCGLMIGKSVTVEDILDSLFIHPSLSEGLLEAAIKIGLEV
ncbi:MAG: NAD(P)/FAD-dependent oxidoreductase [Spirochaetales bacterium]|nr:NAD(P)/FAD-dependent oxidoreductase [Spirochaetales bacterium]